MLSQAFNLTKKDDKQKRPCFHRSPIELKIFARQIRDAKKHNLRVLDISSSNLDDECLYQAFRHCSRLIFFQSDTFLKFNFSRAAI
jgi:hypothetical protein